MDDGRIYGRGIAFPPALGVENRVAWSAGPDNVRESIRVILATEPGERLFLPEFGAGLRRFLFEPNTVATRRLIQDRIAESIRRWEPRIKLESVNVEPDPSDGRAALAIVTYALIATQVREQLAFRVPTGA
jgi:phage baseplate assembly protein W